MSGHFLEDHASDKRSDVMIENIHSVFCLGHLLALTLAELHEWNYGHSKMTDENRGLKLRYLKFSEIRFSDEFSNLYV
ncbi:hypothetical protein RCL_jg22988.t1 [Rhizophagus clarus]|uniref:Uncharacterized protein n=1 Tax=Rhizophagus clarus TaxID=94130 RepID=A0A8H3QKM9_9GLOM|nr:hypothetical protein RCL_jg22988.t1 [Rhizophagus clarus]